MSGLIKTLASKPWLHDEDFHGSPIEVRAFQLPQEKVGLRVFLAVATSLFLLFIVSYRMRMYYQDWVPLKEPAMMWFNTGVLVMASVFMQLSKNAAAVESWQSCKRWFQLGGIAAAAFVGLQWLVWNQLAEAGHFVYTNPASSFFYLITAIHGIHIIGGIFAWARCLSFADSDKQRFRMGVDLCTVYWHYLLLVWAVLFYLLLTT